MEQRLANAWNMTINERNFIETALKSGIRVDDRGLMDYRDLTIEFDGEDGYSYVQLGETKVMGFVTAQLVKPYKDRPNEGSLAIYTEFSPMADPTFEIGRLVESAVELGRIIDRGLRESRAVDTESLCVLAGNLVWSIRVDLHILDNGGNLVDAANTAALAALMTFRRPECTLGGEDGMEVKVHSPEEQEPLPLIVHHLPIAVTFAFITDNNIAVIDPSHFEEALVKGRMIVTVNANEEVCAIQKAGGVGITPTVVLTCLQNAALKAVDITLKLQNAVESFNKKRSNCKIKHLSDLEALDIGLDGEIREHESQTVCVKTELSQQMQNLGLQIDKCNDVENEELPSKTMIDASHNKSTSSCGKPLCWDPYSKGVDLKLLKVSLATRGKLAFKEESEQNSERRLLEGNSGEAIEKKIPLQVLVRHSDVGSHTNRVKTLKDAVKPRNKRKKLPSTVTTS
ncbi:exosome complex component RRP45A-like [Silene latifolia]|uniref:exosome complex component RRP45A-like n=1 Tax=Silene latifolia TaxID=37657 RepID=UPI003D78842B